MRYRRLTDPDIMLDRNRLAGIGRTMHKLPVYRRLLLLTEGQLGVFTSKTAAVVLKYRPADVVAVLDEAAAGKRLAEIIPWAPAVPILADVARARDLRPDALFVGRAGQRRRRRDARMSAAEA
jgi:hypothetical protein